jgi:flagellar FliJ protein
MAGEAALQQLIALAKRKTESAARALAVAIARAHEADRRLRLLVDYRRDYYARFQEAASAGIDHERLRNFHGFMEHLDAAIAEQHKVLADARHATRRSQAAFEVEQQRMKSYDVLAQRRAAAEELRASRREQREQDDHAAKMHARRQASA